MIYRRGEFDRGWLHQLALPASAVRFMTIHACKGLEFNVVHLPVIASRYFPVAHRPARCPPPPGLERLGLSKEDHQAEEECLFFVALSRARDVLSISRSAAIPRTRPAALPSF
jgi:DNA helicase-2/ATP-dependent DNA helicase PcrA